MNETDKDRHLMGIFWGLEPKTEQSFWNACEVKNHL